MHDQAPFVQLGLTLWFQLSLPSMHLTLNQEGYDTANNILLNSLAPGYDLKAVIFKLMWRIDILRISSWMSLRWMPQHLTDD